MLPTITSGLVRSAYTGLNLPYMCTGFVEMCLIANSRIDIDSPKKERTKGTVRIKAHSHWAREREWKQKVSFMFVFFSLMFVLVRWLFLLSLSVNEPLLILLTKYSYPIKAIPVKTSTKDKRLIHTRKGWFDSSHPALLTVFTWWSPNDFLIPNYLMSKLLGVSTLEEVSVCKGQRHCCYKDDKTVRYELESL